jgi:hypothetical protein
MLKICVCVCVFFSFLLTCPCCQFFLTYANVCVSPAAFLLVLFLKYNISSYILSLLDLWHGVITHKTKIKFFISLSTTDFINVFLFVRFRVRSRSWDTDRRSRRTLTGRNDVSFVLCVRASSAGREDGLRQTRSYRYSVRDYESLDTYRRLSAGVCYVHQNQSSRNLFWSWRINCSLNVT